MTISKTKMCLLLIVFFAVLSYANSLFNEFTYDDGMVLTSNYFIKNIKNLPRLFTSDYFHISKERTFRPIAPAALFLEYTLFKYKPFGYHTVNLILHLINSILLFLLARKLAVTEKASFIASIIFLVHPAISETIFCVSYMEDLWGLMFYFLAIILYLVFYEKKNLCYLIFCGICFFISLLSKEMGITFIAVMPLLLFFYRNEKIFSRKNIIFFYIPSLLISVTYLYLRFYVFFNNDKPASYPDGSFLIAIYNIPRILLHYIKLMFFPINLTADYQFQMYDFPFRLPVITALSIAVALIICIFKLKRDYAFWISYFLINFLPVSGIIPFGAIVAERYIYFSSAGFAVIAGIFLTDKRIFCALRLSFIITIMFCFQILLIMRAPDWKNNESLWSSTAKRSPEDFSNKAELHMHLGNIHYQKGNHEAALREFLVARQMNPYLTGCYNNIGIIYMEKGYPDLAEREFLHAIRMNEKAIDAYFSLSALYMKKNEFNKSEELMLKAIKINPEYAVGAYNNLHFIELKRNRPDKAIQYLHKILQIDPKNENAYVNIASVYNSMNQTNKAEPILIDGLRNIPESSLIRSTLGKLFQIENKYDQAIQILSETIKMDPSFASAYVTRAAVFYALNNWELARLDLETAITLDPNQIEAINNLAVIYAQEGNIDKAKSLWKKSLSMNPNQPKIIEYLK